MVGYKIPEISFFDNVDHMLITRVIALHFLSPVYVNTYINIRQLEKNISILLLPSTINEIISMQLTQIISFHHKCYRNEKRLK